VDLDPVVTLLQVLSPAAVIGGLALWRSHRVERRNLLLKLHEQLLSPEKQQGRRLIHEYATAGRNWWDPSPTTVEDVDKMNSALALFDVAGWYMEKKYVDADDFLDLWAVPLVRTWYRAYHPYISVRHQREEWSSWPNFEKAVERAEAFLQARGQTVALGHGEPPTPAA
jgi:hypothetical protein